MKSKSLAFASAAVCLSFFFSISLWAAECSHLWEKNLEINPSEPKGYSGDTYAAYGLMGYKNKANLKWVFKGNFPKGRFMSIETYTTEKKRRYDVQFDYQLNPDPGSLNPFQEGIPMDTPHRSFTVELIAAEGKSTQPNVIHISPEASVHAIYYRIYAPSNGVVLGEQDLPKVYAYDALTGEPTDCPQSANVVYAPNFPQFLAGIVEALTRFEFKEKVVNNGQNSAVPSYAWALNRVRHGDVTIVRFKAPTFFNNQSGAGPFVPQGQVRYWSFCTQNFVKSQTLNCLPDYLATVDSHGYANIVVGKGPGIEEEALRRGFSFLEDRRLPNQHVEGFAYRNLLPTQSFEELDMYVGDYLPTGTSCSAKTFLAGGC